MKKIVSVIVAFAMLTFVLAGCAAPAAAAPASKLDQIKSAGKIRVGMSADFPPYEFHDVTGGKDEIAGFDVSLIKEIASDIGVEVEIIDQDFDGLIAALQANSCDVVISGMNATEERKTAVDFSDEYFFADQAFLVRLEDEGKYDAIESVNGQVVGAQLGTIQETIANEQFQPQGAEIFCIASTQNLVLELKSKNVVGVILDRPIAEAFVSQNPDLTISKMPIVGDDSGFAIAINKGNSDLVESINKTLKRLKDEDKIDAFFTAAVELAAQQTAE